MLFQEAASGPDFFALAPWVVFIPAIGLILNTILGRWQGERFSATVACLASGLAFVVSVLLFLSLQAHPEGATVVLLDWIAIGSLDLQWAFRIDSLSVTMML
ncbi:MAG TPA: hypothetical protein VMN57_01150, partial [Anaerolineales bacterium]|nr:hypothetical protein [Anaerolineales bacterium]